jgi:hypothetical protein
MLRRVLRGARKQPVCRFTNDAEVPQHPILEQCIRHEIGLGFAAGIPLNSVKGFEYVLQVILGAFGMPVHTG